MEKVKVWKTQKTFPTYEVGEAEKYPVFLEKRVYQGSSGSVYPYAVIESVADSPKEIDWEVIYLENRYIKIMLLPALGGRVQMAYDKVKKRHFVYYNQVIKPALVGLTGPWISGGIEFNWPQHHRPSTYEPVECEIQEQIDGSKTVWLGEVERMGRTKGMAGFTLYPDKAYLEIKGRVFNGTPHPQTFLWWANPAVSVNDQYQSVFPPDVNAVFDHGKRDVSEFPIAKGVYYKVDYAPGTDISKYANIPVPTSYMAINSDYDFVGGYDKAAECGLLHVANHHISPGKKQWTWGNGDFGRAWDRNLTDSDGPYIELMCGVYTDNQPDFAWLHPYEEKRFEQYFLPYHKVGMVKNATKEALLNFEVNGASAHIIIHVTAVYEGAKLQVHQNQALLLENTLRLDPEGAFELRLPIEDKSKPIFKVLVQDDEGKVLVSWESTEKGGKKLPSPAQPAQQPAEKNSVEQLYLRGQHLEQYRHATYDPTDYYLEALDREPANVRVNNAMGLLFMKRGLFQEALAYFDIAITTLTQRNPNPYDGEALYNKGLCLNYMGDCQGAYQAFYKSCWNAAWQDAGYFHLARLDCMAQDYEKALYHLENALVRNTLNHKARHLEVVVLRKSGNMVEAEKKLDQAQNLDKLSFGLAFESLVIHKKASDLTHFMEIMGNKAHNFLELAIDYGHAGMVKESVAVLQHYLEWSGEKPPMVFYLLGYYQAMTGAIKAAQKSWDSATKATPDYCFPNRLEELIALKKALEYNSQDARAHYYLGNFQYHAKSYEKAKKSWEQAVALDTTFAIPFRNLALCYYNKFKEKDSARVLMSKAFALDYDNARLFMEFDQLNKKMNVSVESRLSQFERNITLIQSRDDLYIEWVTLHNLMGHYQKALDLIAVRNFHPWEGGEGKISFQYVTAHIELAKQGLMEEAYEEALSHLASAQIYPENLGEGKLLGTLENDIQYWQGCVYEAMGDTERARSLWLQAASGKMELQMNMYYNDQRPDQIFYQGLALVKLGDVHKAQDKFNNLILFGEAMMHEEATVDYFAVSLPDMLIWNEDLNARQQQMCLYLKGLGYLGQQKMVLAVEVFAQATQLNRFNVSLLVHKRLMSNALIGW
ncbi:DUF5107 domain-containing protein [Sediminicola luteus]|uniref:DUF5107 domain-containing protein n=1 Tax=Sediminicola luteus TaxID=319238 RepID=A0A2A4GA10_9FLAO|nr:DUF5107 domain-containing protein [Sediminicola luteus]PCE64810.1 DUF5107 domain-containing protein [Sediminicola luteus]